LGGHYDILYKEDISAPIAEDSVPTPLALSPRQQQNGGNSLATGAQGAPAVSKKFICVKPVVNETHLLPFLPLETCVSCRAETSFVAYFEAVAHVRFWHFRLPTDWMVLVPKEREGKENRDWPSLLELEPWIKEVDVVASLPKPPKSPGPQPMRPFQPR